MTFWAPVFLSAATGSMLALPLAPALTELRRRRDAAPLPTRVDDGRIDNFAASMREYMAPLVSLQGQSFCTMPDGVIGRVVRQEDIPSLPNLPIDTAVFAPNGLMFPMPACFLHELYVQGDLRIANDSLLRATLVEGNADLGERTAVARWIHVEGDLDAAPEARLFGRASAIGTITLRHGCTFERLRATTIYTGVQTPCLYETSPVWRGSSLLEMRLGRVRSGGDFYLRDSDTFQGHIVATGRVAIGDSVLVLGSVKARKEVEIGSGTLVEGTVVCRGRMSIAQRCYIKGPVLSEQEIVIGADTQVGTPASPTTVSAPRIRIAPGARVYGSIWARETGEVTA